MPDGAVRLRHAFDLLRLEGLLQEIDQFGHPLHGQIGCNGVIAIRNCFDCHWRSLLCIVAFFARGSFALFPSPYVSPAVSLDMVYLCALYGYLCQLPLLLVRRGSCKSSKTRSRNAAMSLPSRKWRRQ